MNNECSVELLQSALAGQMSSEREELLHRHLEECQTCLTAMEEMAGGEAGCREAAELLAADAVRRRPEDARTMVQRRFLGRLLGIVR